MGTPTGMMHREKYNRDKIQSGEWVYIGRGFRYHNIPRSKWHNPFPVEKYGRDESIRLFREYITTGRGNHLLGELDELAGRTICCHCGVHESCHGDVLMELVNRGKPAMMHGCDI